MDTVVLFPGFGMGHLTPTVELAKLFTRRNNLAVTIILMEPPLPAPSMVIADAFTSTVTSAHPLISFHRLPKPPPPTSPPSSNVLTAFFENIRLLNPLLLDYLRSLSREASVRALVLDMFCTSALDVARELHIPSYIFYSSAASSLVAFLYLPTLFSQMSGKLRDLGDSPVVIPGLPPIPASDFPDQVRDPNESCEGLLLHLGQIPEAEGVLINTFEELELRAVRALKDGLCLGPDVTMPPVYCVGPLIAAGKEGDEEEEEKHECLKWLDEQPKGSVVFLCFGSMGSFSAQQLKEIAIGLEGSQQRFLWVVRSPPSSDPAERFTPKSEPDLEALMPEGFLQKTEGRGLVVKSWAPQTAVLAHEAVGGFVSHCGWNSTLETVSFGVPVIAWPLYAEQQMNKVFLVEEMKLGVEMKGYDQELVSAEEVEMKVRWLMESEGGRELKNRAAALKESAADARNGGSSEKAWKEFVCAIVSKDNN